MNLDELAYVASNGPSGPRRARRQEGPGLFGPTLMGRDAPCADGPDAALRWAREEAARAAARAIGISTPASPGYPDALRELGQTGGARVPPAIYARGDLRALELPSVALVGSRRATAYGAEVARGLARGLAELGVAVVSGLARGIDGAAHRGALEAPGVTVAVLGSGLLRCYPREHADLLERVAATGLALSEFALEMPPLAHNFPRRNRIIAALADVVVVVEATASSGSRHTAEAAMELGRTVMAVPGPITSPSSRGCHELIRDGAAIAASIDDVLLALRDSARWRGREVAGRETEPAPEIEASGRVARYLLVERARHVEELARCAGLDISEVLAELGELVLLGLAKQLPGQHFQRVYRPRGNGGS